MWNALLVEVELRQAKISGRATDLELYDAGVPWVPRLGARAPLGARLERVARTGTAGPVPPPGPQRGLNGHRGRGARG